MIVVDVDVRPVNENRLHAEHYMTRARRRRLEREATLRALAPFPKPTPPVVVTLVRVGPIIADDDAPIFAMKKIRDAVGEWLGTGDGPKAPVRWRYAQARARVPIFLRERGRTRRAFKIWCQVKIQEVRHVEGR